MASLSSSICKMPPLMICNPDRDYAPDKHPTPASGSLHRSPVAAAPGRRATIGYLDFGNGASG